MREKKDGSPAETPKGAVAAMIREGYGFEDIWVKLQISCPILQNKIRRQVLSYNNDDICDRDLKHVNYKLRSTSPADDQRTRQMVNTVRGAQRWRRDWIDKL
jgi:hypothetical protein